MKVHFDIDTQIDFMFPAGALYVRGAEKLLPAIAALNREAITGRGKVISTACAHEENDPEFRDWPPHCVMGTVGQMKPCSLLIEKRCIIPAKAGNVAIDGVDQIILEKPKLNLFTNPNTDLLIRALRPEECVVYGVVTEYCVRECATGLLDRGYKVKLSRRAIQSLNDLDAERFLRDFASRPGATIEV
jgi:nicotinamidase/pyrazinamidase